MCNWTGMEQRCIKDLQVASPVGLKVLIHNVNVRHGCLMLVPEGLKVLGGMEDLSVEEIDDATSVWRCKADDEKAIRGLVSSIIYGKAVPLSDDEMKESDLESLIHSL
ncbi:recQ-mediated genome instability protein 1-like isoform X2 [Papaver somniferum]|uniref:recQ-mediated genome instability protein 1-like isoform X2 n=1 Tax=Papaver somniferum TaxID=3469 RepID=UPI000E70000A|nr:recQ-mediated genome instability protein 1-like isoform X2 [Papaver somniferum]